jgi:predicted transcriptional regulator
MTEPTLVHAFKLDRHGLARVFGALEAEVMDAVWEIGSPTVSEVCDRLGTAANYKTVMTVMNRLVDKHALRRHRDRRAYRYSAAESRATFEERVSRQVVEGLLAEFGDLALAHFLDALDTVEPQLIERLSEWVAERSAEAP